jgi:hypothetical protein
LSLLSALLLCLARQGFAQSTPVTDYSDLVTAIYAGNTNITNFSPGSSASPTVISMSATVNRTIQITNSVTIDAGSNYVLFQSTGTNGGTRFFNVLPNGALTLNNVELMGGISTNGGAIYNAGTLVISNCVLTGNVATNITGTNGSSGPINGEGNGANGQPGGNAAGGAIYSTGPLAILSSILTNNFAEAGYGGNGGFATGGLANGGNAGYGGNAFGGALFSSGSNNVIYQTEFLDNECFGGSGGSGGIYATNTIPFEGSGGSAGVGGSCAGGAAFITGSLYISNSLFALNFARAGGTGSDGGGANGSPGGSAFGGALYITNGPATAYIQNTIFFTNACYAGTGGSTTLNTAAGGAGGIAKGGAIWSGAALIQMNLCTVATNYVRGGMGGSNLDNGTNGITGGVEGYLLYRGAGTFDLSDSILSSQYPNAAGVTDEGYNVSSDSSLTKSTAVPTTRLNTNPDLNSVLTTSGIRIGGPFGADLYTVAILTNSPAAAFVPGVPGLSFPSTDEAGNYRSTPTSVGAYELNPIPTLATNVVPSNLIISTLPGTNLTGTGDTVAFTNTVDAQIYTNAPLANLGFQWQLDGTNITDSANYFGTTSNILTVKKVTAVDEGDYTVVISPNLLEGAVTNNPPVFLILTNPPSIVKQLSSLSRPVGSTVTFSLDVGLYPEGYSYEWLYRTSSSAAPVLLTNLENGNIFITNNVLTIDPALASDAGFYSVIVSNGFNSVDYGAKTSSIVRLTIVADHSPPTIKLISPPAKTNLRTNDTLVINGSATDNAQVAYVKYWFTNYNAGLTPAFTTNIYGYASLSTNTLTNLNKADDLTWTITNMPLPGTNSLSVESFDYSSNHSSIITRRFFYEVPSTLTLQTNAGGSGAGTLTGHAFFKGDNAPSNQASLNIGEGYAIVAAPNSTSLLGEWTNILGTNVTVTNGNTLKFIMESNTTIQAYFVSNIYLQTGIRGTYNGLFYASPEFVSNDIVTNLVTTNVSTNAIYTNEVAFESSGMLNNLIVGNKGGFSGRLLLAGDSYSLSGSFDAFGHVTNHVIARSVKLGGPLIIDMDLNTNGGGTLTGSVSNAAWPTNSPLFAELASTTPGTTNYTLLMFPTSEEMTNPASPPGTGYALIDYHGGSVHLSGGLADGTTFTQTVPAAQSNDVPVYVSLYAKTGFLFGWLNLTNFGSTNAPDDLIWSKGTLPHPTLLYPDGFTNIVTAVGSIWTNPGVITLPASNTLTISNADLDLNYTVAISGSDKLINANPGTPENSLAGTINLKNGQLQVTFGNGNGKSTARGFGALLQDTNYAGGYFVTKTNAGIIILDGSGATSPSALPGLPPLPKIR